MFCALNGATSMPSSRKIRQSAAVVTDLPTSDAVPRTISAGGRAALPGTRPPPLAVLRPAQRAVDAGAHLDDPPEQPQEIGQPVEIGDHLRRHRLALGQP